MRKLFPIVAGISMWLLLSSNAGNGASSHASPIKGSAQGILRGAHDNEVPLVTSTPSNTITPSRTRTPTNTVTRTNTRTATRTVTPTRTTTPTSTPIITPACTLHFSGALTSADPTQQRRVRADGQHSVCSHPHGCPGTTGTGQFRYDIYSYTNNTQARQCVAVRLNAGSCTSIGNLIFSVAYLHSFNPTDPCQNYLADIGASPNPSGSYSFNLPAGATAKVVVHLTAQIFAGCASYTGSISGQGCSTGMGIGGTDEP